MSDLHRSDNPESYRKNASFVYNEKNTAAVLSLLGAQPGEHILDVGCGSGELTQNLASTVASGDGGGFVVGVDASEAMISAANRNSAEQNHVNLRYHVGDGCQLESVVKELGFSEKFDKVLSNAAIHWMKKSPLGVIQGVHAALKAEGVFAAEFGGFLNVVALRGACHHVLKKHQIDPLTVDPWYFPTPEAYRELLESPELPSPFKVEYCELVPRPTLLPNGVRSFLHTFCGPFLNALPQSVSREEAMDEIEDILRPDMYDPRSRTWTAMYVRLRVKAVKQPASKADAPMTVITNGSPSRDPSSDGFVVTTEQAAKLAHSPTSESATSAVQTLQDTFLNKTVMVHIPDGRVFKGVFTCVDDGMNLIMSQAEECKLHPTSQVQDSAGAWQTLSTEDRIVERRMIGMIMIKGSDIVKIELQQAGQVQY